MRIWIVKAGERGEGMDIAWEGDNALVFADDSYAEAFEAFKKMVQARIGTNAMYSYPGEIGHMARVHVVAQGGGYFEDDYTDIVELRPYEVIGS